MSELGLNFAPVESGTILSLTIRKWSQHTIQLVEVIRSQRSTYAAHTDIRLSFSLSSESP